MTARIRAQDRAARARVEPPLPDTIEVGEGTAFVVSGSVEDAPPGELRLRSGRAEWPVETAPAPRNSGSNGRTWWSLVRVPPAGPDDGSLDVALLARRGRASARRDRPGTRVRADRDRTPRSRSAWPPTSPSPDRLVRQLDSIRAQTRDRLDLRDQRRRLLPGGRSPAIERAVEGDPRFVVSRSERAAASTRTSSGRSGWLRATPSCVALCDQDDRWHPDKLEVARRGPRRATPTRARLQRHADRRRRGADPLATPSGTCARTPATTSPRWRSSTPSPARRRSSGASCSTSRFPSRRGTAEHYHDHWLALCALASGRDRLPRPADLRLHAPRRVGDPEHGSGPGSRRRGTLGERAAIELAPLDPPRCAWAPPARLARRLLRALPADPPVRGGAGAARLAAHPGRQAPRPDPAGRASTARRGPRPGCSAAPFAR